MEATLAALEGVLARWRFYPTTEVALQEALAKALTAEGLSFRREVLLESAGRIDFFLDSGVGVELKVKGSLSAVTRQLFAYAGEDAVRALVLITTRATHRALPSTLRDKPLRVYVVGGGLL